MNCFGFAHLQPSAFRIACTSSVHPTRNYAAFSIESVQLLWFKIVLALGFLFFELACVCPKVFRFWHYTLHLNSCLLIDSWQSSPLLMNWQNCRTACDVPFYYPPTLQLSALKMSFCGRRNWAISTKETGPRLSKQIKEGGNTESAPDRNDISLPSFTVVFTVSIPSALLQSSHSYSKRVPKPHDLRLKVCFLWHCWCDRRPWRTSS